MKITFLARSLAYGGAERQLVLLAKELQRRGHSVLVIVFYAGGVLEDDLRAAGTPIASLEKRHRWDVFGFLLRLIRLLRQERPQVLHGYLNGPNILTALLKPFCRGTRIVWGVRASDVDLGHYGRFARLTYGIECRLSRFADLIISNSQAGCAYAVAHGFPKARMIVIPNGIDTERFCPDLAARQRVRAEWNVADTEILIGRVGRLDPMKDYPSFLKAAAQLARERADLRFVCVGEGPEEQQRSLRALSDELGLQDRLLWAGARGDMPAAYNALDIGCSSSLFGEGFPNVIGEAMACGVPCVVTDVGDSAWIVGESGIVTPRNAPEALACGLRRLLEQPRAARAQQARQRILENFSGPQLMERTEQALWLRD